MINFDCKPQEYGYGSAGSDGYGSASSDGYDSSGYDSSDIYGGSDSAPQYKCKKTPETKCYTTPRTVSSEYCEDREEEVCEKLTERVPVPKEKQVCHDEKKKVCELEQRSQPKQVKKYVYTKQCRPVPKTVCDTADQMSLVPRVLVFVIELKDFNKVVESTLVLGVFASLVHGEDISLGENLLALLGLSTDLLNSLEGWVEVAGTDEVTGIEGINLAISLEVINIEGEFDGIDFLLLESEFSHG